MSDLLARAKAVRARNVKGAGDEEVDVSIAWLKGDVTFSQISEAMGLGRVNTGTYSLISRGLREAYRRGLLKVVE